jgi:hypothetical protein
MAYRIKQSLVSHALQNKENVDHILLQCEYAREVWHGCLEMAGLQIDALQPDSNLTTWWLAASD